MIYFLNKQCIFVSSEFSAAKVDLNKPVITYTIYTDASGQPHISDINVRLHDDIPLKQ
jgi:hypothetical protein